MVIFAEMTDEEKIIKASEQLMQAELNKTCCAPVRDIIGAEDLDLAYQVQQMNITKKLFDGDKVVGKKIGLTSFAVQKQLGVDQPDYGILLASKEIKNGEQVSFTDLMQPKVEAEIAFVMGKDFDKDFTLENLMNSIDYAVASIEIVGSRVDKWDIKITDTIADNASASHFVLGDEHVQLADIDLVNCQMSLFVNDDLVSEGSGKACMDNPLNAALWLAQEMAKQGSPLKKGEILLSGALGPMAPIKKGDRCFATISGLGDVEVGFE